MTQRSQAGSELETGNNAVSPSQRPSSSAAALASEVVAGGAQTSVEQYVRSLADAKEPTALQAARVVEEIANQKPELLAAHIERLVALLGAERTRVAQCAAHCLPILARVAPAKVAKHLKVLQGSFATASEIAKDGLVRTFVALCIASVTYQKRLIEVFEAALREADPKQLASWVEHILPALKGEPYAQARAVVEARLHEPALPRPCAQRVAELLGTKLRAAPERK
jgi:hypothetical protein